MHHAHLTPLQTTPPVNTTPMSRSPHYPTISSHRNDLLPTTTSTTHGTHPSSPSSSPSLISIPHTHPTYQFLRFPPPERELYMHLNTGTSCSLHKSHANPRFACHNSHVTTPTTTDTSTTFNNTSSKAQTTPHHPHSLHKPHNSHATPKFD